MAFCCWIYRQKMCITALLTLNINDSSLRWRLKLKLFLAFFGGLISKKQYQKFVVKSSQVDRHGFSSRGHRCLGTAKYWYCSAYLGTVLTVRLIQSDYSHCPRRTFAPSRQAQHRKRTGWPRPPGRQRSAPHQPWKPKCRRGRTNVAEESGKESIGWFRCITSAIHWWKSRSGESAGKRSFGPIICITVHWRWFAFRAAGKAGFYG